jgi:hypothetical protein
MAEIEYKTPQDVADEKYRKKAGEIYDKSLTNTMLAPKNPPPKAPPPYSPPPKKTMAKGGHAQKQHEKIDLKHCSISTAEHKNPKHKMF